MVINSFKKDFSIAQEPQQPLAPAKPAKAIKEKKPIKVVKPIKVIKKVARVKKPAVKTKVVANKKTKKTTPVLTPVNKEKISLKTKKIIEEGYKEKITQAIAELPVDNVVSVAPAKPEAEPSNSTTVKKEIKPLPGPIRAEAKNNLPLAAIRSAVLEQLAGSNASTDFSNLIKNKPAPVAVIKNLVKPLIDPVPLVQKLKPLVKELPSLPLKKHWAKLWLPLSSILTGVMIFAVVSLAGIYFANWDNTLIRKTAAIIPLPAVYVNGHFISLKVFYEDTDAFLAYQKRFKVLTSSNSKISAQKQVLQSLLQKEVIAEMAKKQQFKVQDDEVQNEIDFMVANSGTLEQLAQAIKNLYGWDLNQYSEKIIRPLILAQKVEQNFNQTQGNQEIKAKLEDYRTKLVNQENDFSQVAGEINEDETKLTVGDLGWFHLGEILPEFELQFISLNPGELSQVFESSAGYHVIKLLERVVDSKNGQPYYHISQLFLKKASFEDYLNEQIKKAKVLTLIRI
ncbi:MAG: peptidylprolyl isomerase [Patescibacteria group bacterium]|jgi:hypothetical protein